MYSKRAVSREHYAFFSPALSQLVSINKSERICKKGLQSKTKIFRRMLTAQGKSESAFQWTHNSTCPGSTILQYIKIMFLIKEGECHCPAFLWLTDTSSPYLHMIGGNSHISQCVPWKLHFGFTQSCKSETIRFFCNQFLYKLKGSWYFSV